MLSQDKSFAMIGGNSRRDYFKSDDERDESLKPQSLSFFDLSSSQEEFTGIERQSLKKSISFGLVSGDQSERQRPLRRKMSKSSKAAPELMPDVQADLREQRRPRRSTSRRSKSSRSSPETLPDLEDERQRRRPRRSNSGRRSKSSRQSPTSLGSRDSKKQREGRKGERPRKAASMEPKSPRASPESVRAFERVPREHRQPKRSVSSKESTMPLDSHQGEPSDRLRRSKSMMEYSKAHLESSDQKRSLTPERLRPRRSKPKTFMKSSTPLEWHQQLHEKEDQAFERSGSSRALVRKSKSFRKSPTGRESRLRQQQDENKSGRPKSRRSLGNKSESFRNSTKTLDPNQPTPLEWHQHLQQSEERQSERPRSRRSLGNKSESFRKSPTPLESCKYKEPENEQEEYAERRRRSTSSKRSKSSRKSPTPLESGQSQKRKEEDEGEERPSSRRSLGRKSLSFRRKSPTPIESRQSHKHDEGDGEGDRPSRRRSLGRKSISFRRKSPTPLESRELQEKQAQVELHLGPPNRSMGKRSISFRKKSPEVRRSLTPDQVRPRMSMGKKLSLRNLFGNKHHHHQQETGVDWKGFGLKECSYYQINNNSNNNSSGSLKRKTSGSMKRLSSLTKLTRNSISRNSLKDEEMEEGKNWHNATWDRHDDGKGSQERTKTPGPLKNWSTFRRVPNPGQTNLGEEDLFNGRSKSQNDRGYEDVSLGDEHRPKPKRRWSNEKKNRDAHLLTSPKLDQVLLKRNERRQRRSSLTKKLLGNVLSEQHRNVSDHHYPETKFFDNTERDSSTFEIASSQSQRAEDGDEDELGISTTASIAITQP